MNELERQIATLIVEEFATHDLLPSIRSDSGRAALRRRAEGLDSIDVLEISAGDFSTLWRPAALRRCSEQTYLLVIGRVGELCRPGAHPVTRRPVRQRGCGDRRGAHCGESVGWHGDLALAYLAYPFAVHWLLAAGRPRIALALAAVALGGLSSLFGPGGCALGAGLPC